MNKYKYLLSISMLGFFSQVSASDAESMPTDQLPHVSHSDHQFTRHGVLAQGQRRPELADFVPSAPVTFTSENDLGSRRMSAFRRERISGLPHVSHYDHQAPRHGVLSQGQRSTGVAEDERLAIQIIVPGANDKARPAAILDLPSKERVAELIKVPGANDKDTSAAILDLSSKERVAELIKVPGANDKATPAAILDLSAKERVAELKDKIVKGYRLTGSIIFMVDGKEVMRDVVDSNGKLLTLADVFTGKSGIIQINVVLDNSRSPRPSAMQTPEPASPATASALELPSNSE